MSEMSQRKKTVAGYTDLGFCRDDTSIVLILLSA